MKINDIKLTLQVPINYKLAIGITIKNAVLLKTH